MITEKGKKELTSEDYKVLSEILTKAPGVLTPEERAHLVARRGYLTGDTLKEYNIEENEETEPSESPKNADSQDDETVRDYSELKKPELIAECEKRSIEIGAKDTIADLVKLLEADDRGELEEVEEEQ